MLDEPNRSEGHAEDRGPVPDHSVDGLRSRFRKVRAETERLASRLSAEDQVVQSMPDASPAKWHRAHTTWFFETFLLVPQLAGYECCDPSYGFLFNSYYESVGARHARPKRGLITRPSVADVAGYRERVDAAMEALIAQRLAGGMAADDAQAIASLLELGLHHEQQHQELLLMDIKHAFSCNPRLPAYAEPQGARPDESGDAPSQAWVKLDGGVIGVGHAHGGFAFDNEGPRHEVLLRPFRLASRAVTCGEWLAFMRDGGYTTPTLWLSDGWATVQAEGWSAPDYWRCEDGQWQVFTLHGERALRSEEPVVHVSYYEADAFARWAGARLPTEFEWEHAARTQAVEGNLLSSGRLHPALAPEGELVQMFGDVWEWTASAYQPYPGFRPSAGAVGEYNGKFMVDQQVLRGGCAVTPEGHVRPSYRNFFPARSRWMFGGLRLAGDL